MLKKLIASIIIFFHLVIAYPVYAVDYSVGQPSSLTTGTADGNIPIIDDADGLAVDDFVQVTSDGLVGKTPAQAGSVLDPYISKGFEECTSLDNLTPNDADPVVQTGKCYQTANTESTEYTDFVDSDGDYSDFAVGSTFWMRCDDANSSLDCKQDTSTFECNETQDYACLASPITYIEWIFDGVRWTTDSISGKKDADTFAFDGLDQGTGSIIVPNSTSDLTLDLAGKLGINTTDEQLCVHSAADGEISGEVCLSLLDQVSLGLDPSWAYDQESTYRVYPLFTLGDTMPEGITITEWSVTYVGGDPTTELDADLICDTTPDYNPAADATVMDVLDTTAGTSSADTGFDSASCANGSKLYIRFGADPTDDNVLIHFDLWFYGEED